MVRSIIPIACSPTSTGSWTGNSTCPAVNQFSPSLPQRAFTRVLKALDSHAVSVSEPDRYLVAIEESGANERMSVGNQDLDIPIYSIPDHYGRMDNQADSTAIRKVGADIAAEWQ
jgi:hypothetical protein